MISLNIFIKLRNYFATGMLICAPLFITIMVAVWLINFFDSSIIPLIPEQYNPETYLETLGWPFGLPGFGVVILVVALIIVGALFTGLLGKYLVGYYESILQRMPIIRSIYGASKQIIETIFANQSEAFSRAVLVEYPRRDAWTIAFVTGRPSSKINTMLPKSAETSFITIYVPTTPNPTSGFMLIVPESDTIELDMSVEDAIKYVISLGIVGDNDDGTPRLNS